MRKILAFILIFLALAKCDKTKKKKFEKKIDDFNFIARIHTSDFPMDLYKIIGKTSFDKHTSEFIKINWKENFWNEYNSENFNMTDLEVLNKRASRYLSISTSPDTDSTFQFVIGFGSHDEVDDLLKPKRTVRLYLTGSEDIEIPKRIIYLFFQEDFKKISSELDKLYFMEEIEDLYENIE